MQKSDDRKEKKKSKKSQLLTETAGFNASGLAEMGDHELARSQPAIVKAIYTEHKDVAAMTDDEVQSIRTAVR